MRQTQSIPSRLTNSSTADTMLRLLCAVVLVHSSLAQVTCPGLGTFEPTGPFEGWPDPSCPDDPGLELSYEMFNTDDTLGRTFDRNTVPANYNPAYKTTFIAHGWNNNKDTPWLTDLKNDLIAAENINVVIVGWGGDDGASDLNYFRSASDTRTVGAETAEVMMNLINAGGGSAADMHFSGHSLGSHVSGHAGRWAANAGNKVARCTGLDPAGPFFINNTDRSVGLYNDCGDFVDVIHSDNRYGSTPETGSTDVHLGHQDFFPNNGYDQPGCGTDTCDHGFAINLYEASITNNDCLVATEECTNSADIPASCSGCGLNCPLMGYYASNDGNNGRYTLTTSDSGTYC